MKDVQAKHGAVLHLGRCGENRALCVWFDVCEWQRLYGEGTVHLLHQRNGDTSPYPCQIDVKGGMVSWVVTSADVAVAGKGRAELQYHVDDVLVKSDIYTTNTTRSMSTAGPVPPEPEEGWVQEVLNASTVADNAAKEATTAASEAKTSAENAHDSALTAGACLLNTESYMQQAKAAQTAAEQSEANAAESAQDAETSRERASNAVSEAGNYAVQALNAAGRAEAAADQAQVSAELAAQAEDFVRNYQPDWEQNDSAEIGYIRNRPFYSVPGLDEVSVPMEAVSTPSGTMYISPWFSEVAQYRGFRLAKDCDYLVTYDGVEYNCKAFEYTTALEVKSVAIGSPELVVMGASGTVVPGGAGTDAPFAILGGTEFRSFDGETHYVTIAPGVVKLPNEYLDMDGIKEAIGSTGAVQSDWNQNDSAEADYVKNRPFYDNSAIVLPETTVNLTYNGTQYSSTFRVAFDIKDGEAYIVVWDGVDYKCVAEDRRLTTDSGAIRDTGEYVLITGKKEGQATISVLTDGIVKLPNKYLDEDYIKEVAGGGGNVEAVQPDWNQNDSTAEDYINNRPFSRSIWLPAMELNPVERVTASGTRVWASYEFEEYIAENLFHFTVGCYYLVEYDSANYLCKAFSYTGDGGVNCVAIGNPELLAMWDSGATFPAGVGADVPFAVFIDEYGTGAFLHTTGGVHYTTTFLVEKLPNEYLDEEYIKAVAGGGSYTPDNETLIVENGVLRVNTADVVEADNTLPITAAAVHETIGNIEVLLKTI